MPDDPKTTAQINHLELALGGKYKILGKIGAGGFGEVYLGEHTQLHRKVAIKILLGSISTQEDLVKRFQREARSAAALSHPNIIDIYDVGEGEGIYYFVMKYIEGETLSQVMHRSRQMDPAQAVHIIEQVADALDYAHVNNVVHRDIKPANVMLDPYGKALLMDFGVARVQYEGNLTKTGTLLGTPHYLAPEQPLGKAIDGRSDIYSLGIMFYEMLAGHPPFHDDNSITLIFKHINEPPPPLNAEMPDLDPELCFIVHKMIEKAPENRFQTAGEVVEALQKLHDIYPVPSAVRGRSTAPTGALDVPKLLELAQEHIDQNKLSKAFEILGTLAKKDPNNETAQRKIRELIPRLSEQARGLMAANELRQARQVISQITQLSPQNTSVILLREELARREREQQSASETILKEHYVAAQEALGKNQTSQAIEHLTHAATIDSSSQEVKELMKETEGRITSEIRMLCEKLDFSGAKVILDMGKTAFPTLAQTKTASIERHKALYDTFQQAKQEFAQEKWSDSSKNLQKFLDSREPYDFQVFESLRKEAEEMLAVTREKLRAGEKPTPATISKEQAFVSAPAASASRKVNFSRVGIFVILGAVIAAGAWWITDFLKRQARPDAQNVVVVRKTEPTPTATPNAPKPTTGEISITSDPSGAAVFIGTEQKGVTPLKLTALPFGKTTLTLKLKDYQDFTQEFDLNENQAVVDLPVVLLPAAAQIGTLVIQSTPPGVFIALGTRVIGQTPKTLDKAKVGKYNVTLKKDGYVDYTESVRVTEGQTTTVNAQLTEVPKPVVAEVKPKEPEVKPGELVQLGPGVTPPKSVSKTSVAYPDAARKQKLEGTVQLNMLISETGHVIDVRVLKSAHPLLDEAAVSTVKEWVYEPAKKQGVPVKVWLSTSITFVKR